MSLDECIYILDGNALLQGLVHLPETFGHKLSLFDLTYVMLLCNPDIVVVVVVVVDRTGGAASPLRCSDKIGTMTRTLVLGTDVVEIHGG